MTKKQLNKIIKTARGYALDIQLLVSKLDRIMVNIDRGITDRKTRLGK